MDGIYFYHMRQTGHKTSVWTKLDKIQHIKNKDVKFCFCLFQDHMEFRQHKREYYIHKLGYDQVTPNVLREQVEKILNLFRFNLLLLLCRMTHLSLKTQKG